MGDLKKTLQKITYGSIFCILLPLILFFWARQTDHIIQLPLPYSPAIAIALMSLGLLMIFTAMYNLWKKGKGLPMNAFPPKNYVHSGLYYFFHHPIYIGAVFLSFGTSLYFQSSSGFWFISPLFILLIIAFVLGFENEVVQKSFQNAKHKTFFDFPEKNNTPTSWKDKCLIYVWIFIPWLLIYESFIFIGTPRDAIPTNIVFDNQIPFIDYSVVFYILLYPLVLIIPFFLRVNSKTRELIFDSIIGMLIIFYCYLVFPFVVNYQVIEINNIFSKLILLGRETDGATAALPSFHVFWALMVYKYYSWKFPKQKPLIFLISWLIILSCVTTKNHTLLDILFGIIAFYVTDYRVKIYRKILAFCEKISNSWREWRFGSVRLINHGFYAALGGFFGFMIMGYFLPDKYIIVYLIGISGFVGAGLWAQWVEGSSVLLRPFGYYGSVIGVGVTLLCMAFFSDINGGYLLAVSSIAATVIQFFGRFRCLVQGCCHGKPTKEVMGITFSHPKSRVNKISGLMGENLYPTQVYSMAANFIIFFILWRLVSLEMPSTFIAGVYLILSGSSRFVEEYLRGEPQTPYFLGMRMYQWLALLSIVMGIAFTCIASEPLRAGSIQPQLILHSFLYALLVLFAYGIDFPKSNIRFSRLTQ